MTKDYCRYDYFLIWGNGIQYKWNILEILRKKESIKIARIEQYTPKKISKFVKAVYSYDYAPFKHLKDKTKYLMKSKPEIVIIFVINKNPQERSFGQGAFRHIECENIKKIKEEIRNKYNSRIDGKRTEEHVIHASDNESQVDYILKYLGHPDGINFLKNIPNPILEFPYYIPKFEEFIIKNVDMSQIYCNILEGNMQKYTTVLCSIEDSPQYECLNGNISVYESYISIFLGGPLTADYSMEQFLHLADHFVYLEKPYNSNYILVKEFRPKEYLILDGLHRASILKRSGYKTIPVAVIK